MHTKGGLKDEWERILGVLSQIADVYDKVNRVISLWQDTAYRQQGIKNGIGKGKLILDAGCGPGVMSELVLRRFPENSIVLLDPIMIMLRAAKIRVDKNSAFVSGIFEKLPFSDDSFDAVMCGYSIRDARDLDVALKEIRRVLKTEGGKLVIVELGKPDNSLLRIGVESYWRFAVPLLATLRVGKRGILFSALYHTYLRHPTNATFRGMLQSLFPLVEFQTRTLGASVIAVAQKQSLSTTFPKHH